MAKPEATDANTSLSSAQETLCQLWEEHVRYEFSTRNTDDTLATMVDDAYVNHIPVLTGGVGQEGIARVLLETIHSADATGHRDDAGLANNR